MLLVHRITFLDKQAANHTPLEYNMYIMGAD